MKPSHDLHDNDAFCVPWAIAAVALEEPDDTIDLSNATRTHAPHAHCAACQGKRIEALVTTDGDHFHRCLDCHRLWRVGEDSLELVVHAEVVEPPRED